MSLARQLRDAALLRPAPPDPALPSSDTRLAHPVYDRVVKRSLDLVAAIALLIVLSPLLAAIALAVRLDSPGPVIFAQARVGRGGRTFRVYKFRTMIDAPGDRPLWRIDADGRSVHKLPDDPRVTRAGRWLRRASVDELPQLLNVVRGDMSLIGPRPELPDIVASYAPWQHDRHLVRPGITGWWQVSGRSTLPMHENTELDIHYVRNFSPRLDAVIAVKTLWVVVRGRGAF